MGIETELKLKKIRTGSVCMRTLHLTAAGSVHTHGHDSSCAGCGCLPASLAISTLQPTETLGDTQSTICDAQQFESSHLLDSRTLLDNVVEVEGRMLDIVQKHHECRLLPN
jgi:hypothetical protein